MWSSSFPLSHQSEITLVKRPDMNQEVYYKGVGPLPLTAPYHGHPQHKTGKPSSQGYLKDVQDMIRSKTLFKIAYLSGLKILWRY